MPESASWDNLPINESSCHVRLNGVESPMRCKVEQIGTVLAALTVFAAAWPAQAQPQLDRFERQLEQIRRDTRLLISPDIPAEQRAMYEAGGYFTTVFMILDDPDGKDHVLRQQDLNGYFRANFDGVHQFFLRARTGYTDFNTGDDFDGEGDEVIDPDLERAIYRFDYKRSVAAYDGRTIDGNLIFNGGRQLVNWANGLSLSMEIDGALVTGEVGPWSVTALAGRTQPNQPDVDSSRPDFDEDTRRNFFGGIITFQLNAHHQPFFYGIVQSDQNESETLSTINGVAVTPTRFRYDSYYIGFGSTGSLGDNLRYGVEFVYEGGEGLSNSFDLDTGAAFPSQTREDIEAAAMDIRIDYLLNDANRTRFTAELLIASGDTDRGHSTNTFGGNQPGTDDTAFNGFGLINTGLAFYPNASNLAMVRLGASTFPMPQTEPFRRLQVGGELFIHHKLNRKAPIDEPTSDSNNFLGVETDFYANWQITSDLALAVRYGVFFPSSGIETSASVRHFFYTGLTLSF